MSKFTAELEFAKKVAKDAGKVILRYFDADQKTVIKADGSPVTIADKKINSMVIAEIGKHFPQDGVIGEEESTTQYGSGRIWFCDPIDGTKGYTRGMPTAMFSLALIMDGIPQLGVACDPFLKRLYWGVKSGGSFCNGSRLEVSKETLKQGTVVISSSVRKIFSRSPEISALLKDGINMAGFSGAVYKSCLVARGKFVAYFEGGLNTHDVAAIQVIVEEAGGRVSTMNGGKLDYQNPFHGAVISNGVVHDELIRYISHKS